MLKNAGDLLQAIVIKAMWRIAPKMIVGVIQPTAAFLLCPIHRNKAWKHYDHFYYDLGDKIWSQYGFVDGFSIHITGMQKHIWQLTKDRS